MALETWGLEAGSGERPLGALREVRGNNVPVMITEETSIDYDVHGEGPPLVLIGGLGFGRWGFFSRFRPSRATSAPSPSTSAESRILTAG